MGYQALLLAVHIPVTVAPEIVTKYPVLQQWRFHVQTVHLIEPVATGPGEDIVVTTVFDLGVEKHVKVANGFVLKLNLG